MQDYLTIAFEIVVKRLEEYVEDLIRVLKKVADDSGRVEVIYVNNLLLDTIFNHQFGGVTRLLQSVEKTSDKPLKIEAGAGLGGSLVNLFLDSKASISAENKIGEKTKSIIESELTINKKIRLCETSLQNSGLIMENPALSSVTPEKYLKLVDLLSTFVLGEEGSLEEETSKDAASIILKKWKRDQNLTPNTPQVALASKQPFLMAGVVEVQDGLQGSIYIAYPPPPGFQRSVLAEWLFEEAGVSFLKIYWVVDRQLSEN